MRDETRKLDDLLREAQQSMLETLEDVVDVEQNLRSLLAGA